MGRHMRTPPAAARRDHLADVIDGVATRLRALRLARGWTIEHAAERLGISPGYLQRLETAGVNVTLDTLVRLAAGYGLERVGALTDGEPPRPEPAPSRVTLRQRREPEGRGL